MLLTPIILTDSSIKIKSFLNTFISKSKSYNFLIKNRYIKNNYKLNTVFVLSYKNIIFNNQSLFFPFYLKDTKFKKKLKIFKLFFFFLKHFFFLNKSTNFINYIFFNSSKTNKILYNCTYFVKIFFKTCHFLSPNLFLCKLNIYFNELLLLKLFFYKYFIRFGFFPHSSSIFFLFNSIKMSFVNKLFFIKSKVSINSTISLNFLKENSFSFFFFKKKFFFLFFIFYNIFFYTYMYNSYKQFLISIKLKKKRHFLKKFTKFLNDREKKKLISYYSKLENKKKIKLSSFNPFKNIANVLKDQKKRILFYKSEKLKYLYNYIFTNTFYAQSFIGIRSFTFDRLQKYISITKIRNFCIITGSSKSVLKK